MADEQGKPNGKPSPVADDFGSIVARFERAGVDLRQLDPVQIAKAVSLIQRVGPNGRVFTQRDLPRVVDSYLAEMRADPQGQQYLQQLLGQMVGQQSPQPTPRPGGDVTDADEDPRAQEIAQLRQAVTEHQQHLQKLYQDRDLFAMEQQTGKKLNEAYGWLDQSAKSIAGAERYKDYLRKNLTREIGSGTFSDDLLTPHGVQAWTAQELDELQSFREGQAEESLPVGQGGGVSFSDDEELKTVEDVVEKYETILPRE